MKLALAIGLLSFGLTARAAPAPAPPFACGDFLAQLGLQRPEAKFETCKRLESSDPGMDGLDAVYLVEGKDIVRVEQWLQHFAHVRPLTFNCCGWETSTELFTGRDGAIYTIGMGGEAIVSRREDLGKVPFLTLHVTHYFFDP